MSFAQCSGTTFHVNCQPFCPVGFNAYYLGYCSKETQRAVLQAANSAGANTIRAWAFRDAETQSETAGAFQIFISGKADRDAAEAGLRRLDSLIAQAEEAGILLVLPLTNGPSDFGGMALYAQAVGGEPSFFQNKLAQNAYLEWAEHLLTRRNTITGRCYAEEPAVLAWELANEPRHSDRKELLDWVAAASEAIKRIDKNHLLAVGDEGFFNRLNSIKSRFAKRTHLFNGRYGVDAEAFLRLPSIDFGTYHLYPEKWSFPVSFGEGWIARHRILAQAAGKPMVLEEFALSGKIANRLEIYAQWQKLACEDQSGGALFWMLGCQESESLGFRDRYTLQSVPDIFKTA